MTESEILSNRLAGGFIKTHVVLPILVSILILLAFEWFSWDVALQKYFYLHEPGHDWVLSKIEWVEHYLHDRAKTVTHIYVNLAMLVLIGSFFSKSLQIYKRDALFVIVSVISAVVLVNVLKQTTQIYCPDQLTIFGGQHAYVRLFDFVHREPGGECWPGGHASAGFAFLSIYFVVRRHWPRYAWLSLCFGAFMGFFYGSVRMLQGKHFLSHTLWAGIICWVVMACIAVCMFGKRPFDNVPTASVSPASP